MNVTLITTVFNEEKTIASFLNSILAQTQLPNEIIIVDGGSTDSTIKIISKFKIQTNKKVPNIKLISKPGNRSVGRNEAIKVAKNEIIAITDAGCVLDKEWVKEITKPFSDKKVDVVAGYYRGKSTSAFQKSLIPYILVMDDKLNEQEFLPATRSMAIKKSAWQKVGKFDERLSHNEDFAFANKLKEKKFKIVFAKNAIVEWIPRNTLISTFVMFFRFAFGDAESKIFRDKVILIFLRYIFAAYLFCLALVMKSLILWSFVVSLLFAYLVWAVWKNYIYIKSHQALVYLPLLQLTSDLAVLSGTILGVSRSFKLRSLIGKILRNKGFVVITLIYIVLMLSVISWGIPNLDHPFTYHMDEWHFSQALRTFLKYGSGSISGAASIPLYHIVSTIIFLIPFYLLRIIDPFAIKSVFSNLPMQQTFFEVLRLHTLFYGILAILALYFILKKYIRVYPVVFTAFFAFSPIWIFLSNYYKYDITLNFWIIATIFFLFKFYHNQKISSFIYAGISCALALSTKFTAFPLLVSYVLAYCIFSKRISLKHLLGSLLIVIFIFATVGIPDMLLGKGNYYELLHSTLVSGAGGYLNYNLNSSAWSFLLFREFPQMFGYFLIAFSGLSLFYWTIKLLINFRKIIEGSYREELLITVTGFLFLIPLLSVGIEGGANRSLVLLPFSVLLMAFVARDIIASVKFGKSFILAIIVLGLIVQSLQSFAWQSVKLFNDPRTTSSAWLVNNLSYGSKIGIENIPIYQMLPDVVLKEFYLKQYDLDAKTNFTYSVVSASDKNLPKIVIVTNDYQGVNYLKQSPKKELLRKLKAENYKKIVTFFPNLRYYNLFADNFVFMMVNPTPITISVYEN